MGRILRDEEAAEIRALAVRVGEIHVNVLGGLASEYGVSATAIDNILANRSYLRPACYPAGSQGRADAEQRNRDYEADQKRKRQMRYISAVKRTQVLERDSYRCVYCSADLRVEPLAIDHKIPVSAGGTNDVDNLQATCRTCNARKKGFTSPDSDTREYLSRRQRIDKIETKVLAALSPIVASTIWADSESVTCPWCGEVAKRVKDRNVGSADKIHSDDVELDNSFVWRCKPCRRYFTVSNEWYSGLSDFKYNLESVIWGRWAYSGSQGTDEVASIVSAIMNDADNEAIRTLVASWAGDIVVVKRRRHTHTGNGDSWESWCWCEYSDSGFEHTDRTYKQTELAATSGSGTQDEGQVTPQVAQLGS